MHQTHDKRCAECPCARSVAEYARRKGVSFARALALLQKAMEGRPLEGIGPVELCPCEPERAAACPVFALVRRLAAGCGLEPAQWLEPADVLIDGEYEAAARVMPDETHPAVSPRPAEPESVPAPWKSLWTRRRALVLGAALAALVLALAAALWGTYRAGYRQSLEENGTWDSGYSAALAEGTYEEGQAAGYDEGYQVGYREGLQEGFDQGKQAGYSEGYAAGSADGQQAQSDAQQAQTDAENARRATRVWTSWLGSSYHLDPDCPRLWGGDETTLGQAEDEGYTPCPRCAK